MLRNFIFDWSGTLVDDLGPVIEATNAVLGRYGLAALDREAFRRQFRLPYREFYAEVLPAVPLEELEGHFRLAFAAAASPVTVLPHAREKLEWCRALGLRAFVLTSMDASAFDSSWTRSAGAITSKRRMPGCSTNAGSFTGYWPPTNWFPRRPLSSAT